jgi:hypothetical protein
MDVGYTYVPEVTNTWFTLMRVRWLQPSNPITHLTKGLNTLSHLTAGKPHLS